MGVYCRVISTESPVPSTQCPEVGVNGGGLPIRKTFTGLSPVTTRAKPSTARVRQGAGFSSGDGPRAIGRDIGGCMSSRTLVNLAVLATMSDSLSPVRINSTGGLEVEDVLAQGFIPYGEAGNNGGVGAEGDTGETAGGAGGDSEEVDEDPLRRGHVGVHEDANGLAGFHGGEQAANEIVFVDGAVAVHGAVTLDQGVDVGIVERAHDDRKGMAVEGVGEGGEFPGSEVSGEKEDAFAASVGTFEIFKAFVDDDAGDIFFGVAGEETDFGELASEGDEFSANDAAAIGLRTFPGRRGSGCGSRRGEGVGGQRRR